MTSYSTCHGHNHVTWLATSRLDHNHTTWPIMSGSQPHLMTCYFMSGSRPSHMTHYLMFTITLPGTSCQGHNRNTQLATSYIGVITVTWPTILHIRHSGSQPNHTIHYFTRQDHNPSTWLAKSCQVHNPDMTRYFTCHVQNDHDN